MVMVSHEKKFIFLKTRKTAGTSCEMMLEPWCAPPGRIVIEPTHEMVSDYGVVGARLTVRRGQVWKNHMPAAKIAELLGPERWGSYLKLTSVRNPFKRAVSFFYWSLARKDCQPPACITAQKAAFRDFIFSGGYRPDELVTHVDGQYVVDDAIRLENLAEDVARVGARLGLNLSAADLPRTKDTTSFRPAADLREFFTGEIERRIKRKQSWVFEHFDYPDSAEAAFAPKRPERAHLRVVA